MSHDNSTPPEDGWLEEFFFDRAAEPPEADTPIPPLTAYAEEDFTAPISGLSFGPVEDERPTTVIRMPPAPAPEHPALTADESPTTLIPIPAHRAPDLSDRQQEILERIRARSAAKTPGQADVSSGADVAGGAGAGSDASVPRGAQPPAPSGRKRRSVLVRASVSALAFSLVLVLTAVGIAGLLYEKYNGQLKRVAVLQTHDANIVDPARQQHAENFLVIGSDSRAGQGTGFGQAAGARSDTTMIVHLSPSHTKATIVSIPRDAWVAIPACKAPDGHTVAAHTDMFNSAFSVGGPACTIATVQKLTGIAVTHFVEIDFKGFESMVSALGTVNICSPEKVDDKGSGLHLHVGNNKLDGAQALAYVRARETLGDGSDLGRIKRQQMFLGAVLRQAMDGSILSSPTRLTAFLDAATKSITIDKDTSFGDLRTLATSLQGLNTKQVTFYTAPIANPDYSPPGTTMTGRVLLDATQGRALYNSVIADRTPVWVMDKNGKTAIVDNPEGGTPTKASPTKAGAAEVTPALPKANLNAAQQTCSL